MLHAYGENGFTFLLFQHLHNTNQLVQAFLANLKRFDDGKTFGSIHKRACEDDPSIEMPEVWLFPNFGKSVGFGEPDAIVLWNGFSFWIEVETNFDLVKKGTDARNAIIQLLRFHYFSQAIMRGRVVRGEGKRHYAIVGTTISGKQEARPAVLRVAGHGVLSKIEGKLKQSAIDAKDHYVVLSDYKMKGISLSNEEAARSIKSLLVEYVDKIHPLVAGMAVDIDHPKPAKPHTDRFWYQYYKGDLKKTDTLNIDTKFVRYVSRKQS